MKYNAEQVTFMLAEAIDENREYKSWHCSTQHLMALVERVVAEEREAIAQMLEDAPALVEFAQNDKGGCLMCGFTPKLAAEFIRARGQEPEQKSVAMADYMALTEKYVALKAAQRTWVGLTDDDKESFWTGDQMSLKEWDELYAAVEAKLKEKNNATP